MLGGGDTSVPEGMADYTCQGRIFAMTYVLNHCPNWTVGVAKKVGKIPETLSPECSSTSGLEVQQLNESFTASLQKGATQILDKHKLNEVLASVRLECCETQYPCWLLLKAVSG
jgi:hypothetical protein